MCQLNIINMCMIWQFPLFPTKKEKKMPNAIITSAMSCKKCFGRVEKVLCYADNETEGWIGVCHINPHIVITLAHSSTCDVRIPDL